jgi:hypothetical protein
MQSMIETAAKDPLIAFLALVISGVFASHVLFRKYSLGRSGVRVAFLILLTGLSH